VGGHLYIVYNNHEALHVLVCCLTKKTSKKLKIEKIENQRINKEIHA
jgi:hypothetical protein